MKRFLLLFSLFFTVATFSQDVKLTKTEPFRNSVGIRFSNITGYGLSFSKRVFDNYTVKAGGIIFYNEYVKGYKDSIIQDTKNIIYDYGFEIQRDIYKTDKSRVYALGGMYFSKFQDKNQERDWQNMLITSRDDDFDKVAGGIGIGIEFLMHKRFGINVDFGYRFEHSDGKESGIPVEENTTTVGLGIGLSYLY